MGKAIHAFANFVENHTIVNQAHEFVLFHDAGWDIFDWDPHVLESIHGSVEIEIFDVDGHELGLELGDDTVEQDLDSGKIGSRSAELGRWECA